MKKMGILGEGDGPPLADVGLKVKRSIAVILGKGATRG